MSFKSGVKGRGSDRWWERRWWLWWGDMRRMRWTRRTVNRIRLTEWRRELRSLSWTTEGNDSLKRKSFGARKRHAPASRRADDVRIWGADGYVVTTMTMILRDIWYRSNDDPSQSSIDRRSIKCLFTASQLAGMDSVIISHNSGDYTIPPTCIFLFVYIC